MRIPYISLLAAGALALGGCAYGDLGLGMGYGSPYGGYGYGSPYGGYGYGNPYYGSSISIGYGSSYGGYYPYSRYGGYGGYGSYGGYGYGSPYYGWYDNYYYPGTGYYVYDSYRRPHVMSTTQRQYWTTRSPSLRTTTSTRTRVQPNWSGFDRQTARAQHQSAHAGRHRRDAERDRLDAVDLDALQTTREQRRQERQDRRRDNSGY